MIITRYIVKEYEENDKIYYGVYDNQCMDPMRVTYYQNLILFMNEKEHADIICDLLNLENENDLNTI